MRHSHTRLLLLTRTLALPPAPSKVTASTHSTTSHAACLPASLPLPPSLPASRPVNQIGVAKDIIAKDGFGALYKGLSAGLLRQATYTTARLGIFQQITAYAKEANGGQNLPLWQKAACGLTAGGLGALVGTPADLTLIRMQASVPLAVRSAALLGLLGGRLACGFGVLMDGWTIAHAFCTTRSSLPAVLRYLCHSLPPMRSIHVLLCGCARLTVTVCPARVLYLLVVDLALLGCTCRQTAPCRWTSAGTTRVWVTPW